MYMSNCTYPLVLSEDYRGWVLYSSGWGKDVVSRMSRARAGKMDGCQFVLWKVSGIWLNYQKTSILRINCSIANAGNLRARHAVKVRDTGRTGTPTGVRARACAQDTLGRHHRIL